MNRNAHSINGVHCNGDIWTIYFYNWCISQEINCQALEFKVYIDLNERVLKKEDSKNNPYDDDDDDDIIITIIINNYIIVVYFNIQYKIYIICDPGPQNQL